MTKISRIRLPLILLALINISHAGEIVINNNSNQGYQFYQWDNGDGDMHINGNQLNVHIDANSSYTIYTSGSGYTQYKFTSDDQQTIFWFQYNVVKLLNQYTFRSYYENALCLSATQLNKNYNSCINGKGGKNGNVHFTLKLPKNGLIYEVKSDSKDNSIRTVGNINVLTISDTKSSELN